MGTASKSASRKKTSGPDTARLKNVIVVYLAYSASPVPIDDILSLTKLPPVEALNAMEALKKCRLVVERKETGRGVYHKGGVDFQKYIRDRIPGRDLHTTIKTVIDFITDSEPDGQKKILSLAALHHRSGTSSEGALWIKKAADLYNLSGDREKAVEYYDAVIDHFFGEADISQPAPGIEAFLDAVYQRVSLGLFYILPIKRQLDILEKAHDLAKRHDLSILLAKIKIHLGFALLQFGKSRRGNSLIDAFWNLYEALPEKEALKKAFFFASMTTVMLGKFIQATDYYKQVVGTLEKYSDSEEDLSAYLLLAFCRLSCGRISSGMGMIDIVRDRARRLGLDAVSANADIMAANAMLSIRKFKEAEHYTKRLGEAPRGGHIKVVADNLVFAQAYICCHEEEYDEAFALIKQGINQKKSRGMDPHDIGPLMPWVFDCLYTLESKGFSDKSANLAAALGASLNRNNIFIQGVALRYRALSSIRKSQAPESILADLNQSEKLLARSGAQIELARTRVAASKFHLSRGEDEIAMSCMENAASALHGMAPALFPQDLLECLPHERKFDLIAERIADINQAFGDAKNKSDMVELIVNATMDSTSAMQCCFFGWDGNNLKLTASRNFDPASKRPAALKAFHSLIGDAIRRGGEIIQPLEDGTISTALRALGIYSFTGIPVKSNGPVTGYFAVGNHFGGGPFPENTLAIVRMFASQISAGLSYFRAYEELRCIKERFKDETIFHRREMGLEFPIEKIIGQSEAIRKVLRRVYQVAPTDSLALIQGETGVGKELVAKAIHNLSDRKDGPFIPVNLATFPGDLVASELFGHEKGAFSGAAEKKKGRLELADGGTIFLDEIGDLPLDIQVKLLRVLQEGSFERLGSSVPIRSDFRVITATHKNLRYEVEKGNFRQDLYYRLNVFPIYVPPLRERKGDIPLLARHFFTLFNKKFGKYIGRIPPRELEKLLSYHWPGNVRELRHFIEKAVILSNGHEISFSGLERELADISRQERWAVSTLADMEREHIKKTLEKTLWKVSGPGGAASILGVPPTTLRYRMKKLGIEKPSRGSR